MSLITIPALIAAGIAPTQARQFDAALSLACDRFGIKRPVELAAFVAQCAHESADFTRLEESLYYTTPERIRAMWPSRVPDLATAARLCRNPKDLANRVYANRGGNRDMASGDGWRYRGRGLIQLTLRDNYGAAARDLREPYLEQPDLLVQPAHAALTAAWFFVRAGCLALADDIAAVTRRINPAMAGINDRRQRFQQAVQAFATGVSA